MSNHKHDLLVIGAGSGGVRAARIAGGLGAKVAVIEDRYMGGTCVNVGCVPKKLYVYASEFGRAFEDRAGVRVARRGARLHLAHAAGQQEAEISRLNGIYDDLLRGANAEVITGRGSIVDAHTVEVNGERPPAERILVATGGWPRRPDTPGAELGVTSNEVFDLDEFPRRIVIVGGGYIAVEFAGIFAGLGAQVTQLYRGPLFLRGFDQDIREHAARELAKGGLDLRFETNIESIERRGGQLLCALSNGDRPGADTVGADTIETDQVLYAIGREPHLEGLGLENVNVALNDNGTIKVDEDFRTTEPSIFALGDVTGGTQLTPVALGRGHGVCPQAVWARAPGGGVRLHSLRGLLPAQHRHGGLHRGTGAARIWRHHPLQVQLPAHEAHHQRARREHLHEAHRRGRHRPGWWACT